MQIKSIIQGITLFGLVISLFSSVSAGPVLFFDPPIVESNPGDYPTVNLMMEGAGEGLSGYEILIKIDDPSVAEMGAVTFSPWATLNKQEQQSRTCIKIQAADVTDQVQPRSTYVPIVKLELHAIKPGYATLSIEPVAVDNDKKGRYNPVTKTTSIVISGAGPIPTIPIIPMNKKA